MDIKKAKFIVAEMEKRFQVGVPNQLGDATFDDDDKHALAVEILRASLSFDSTMMDNQNREMSWNEFKNHIDVRLAEKNISGDTPIWYIDIGSQELISKDINVWIEENCGVAIS